MVQFLLTFAVLGALFAFGYRLNMYLYSQGAVGVSRKQIAVESLPAYETAEDAYYHLMEEATGSVRYVRYGLAVLALVAIFLLTGLVAFLFNLFH